MWKYVRLALIVFLLVAFPATVTVASTTTDVTVTVTPPGPTNGPPLNFTVTYVDATTANITWTKPGTAVNTLIRVKFSDYPSSTSDGYLVYSGPTENITDTSLYFEENAGTLFYSAWSENATGDYSSEYATDDLENPLMTQIATILGSSWLFMTLLLAALGLTIAMFLSHNPMLGFPATLFWALFGGYSYSLSDAAWDIYFLVAFGSLLGMAIFSAFAAYALRTKKEEAKEGDLYFDEGGDKDVKFIDEGGNKGDKDTETESGTDEEKPSKRTRDIRDRANRRRASLR